MAEGTLIVGRIIGQENKYVMCRMNMENGQILDRSGPMTEDDVRAVLREKFGENESLIETRITAAQQDPAFCFISCA
jgi:hypothetical protein